MGKAGVEGAWQHRWATAAGRGCRHRVNRHDDDHAGMLLRPQWLSEKEECAGEKTDQQEDGQGVGDDLTKLHCSSPIHASLSATSASKLCSMFGTNAPGSQDFSPSCGSSDKRTTCLCTGPSLRQVWQPEHSPACSQRAEPSAKAGRAPFSKAESAPVPSALLHGDKGAILLPSAASQHSQIGPAWSDWDCMDGSVVP